jgi:hypothetical protein
VEVAAEIVYRGDPSGVDVPTGIYEALLERPVLLFISGVDEILEIFVVGYAQEDGRGNAGPLDEKALALVGHGVEDLLELMA